MGSQCSALRRGKVNENEFYTLNQEKDEVSTIVTSREEAPPLHQRSFLQEEEGDTDEEEEEEEEEEESLKRQEEENSEKLGWSEMSSTLAQEHKVAKVNPTSPCLPETCDPDSAITEDRDAEWVDNNMAKLIRDATSVMTIADEMLQRRIIHKEKYSNIEAARTSQGQMREIYKTLTCVKAKSVFYQILQEVQPEICETEDVVKEVIGKHKAYLRDKFKYEFEGTEKDHKEKKSLDKIYTELHIVQGESKHVNIEHEIWEIEDKTRCQTAKEVKINCNDIFKSSPEDVRGMASGQDQTEVRVIRTVMTKGIAGIGKTVSVKKFILDWADGKANQDLDFIFVLPFRELNLVKDDTFSLVTLVKLFHPKLKNIAVAKIFDNRKVLFIFDGLDESQLELNFTAKKLIDATRESSVDTLVINLIREDLLPSALVWITSRPGHVQCIPRQYIYQWTEVRGFNDPQKIQYFRNRVEDEAVAERIIDIDIRKAGLYCGLCTEILREDSVFNKKKFYCFVHLTVQEYFAALFVYHSFATKKIDSLSLKDFLLKGSEEELKSILDADPVDLPLDELMEISIANSTLRKTGELDMFLRFLIGMSLKSTQELLQGLIQQEEEHSATVGEILTSLVEIDLGDCSPERCLNLVHCLIELKDSSLHDTVQKYLNPDHNPESQLTPVQCSAVADLILMSNTPLDEFDLKKYRPSAKGIFRLLPAVRNSRKVRLSGLHFDLWLCETVASALRMPNSVLAELHLTNSVFYDKGIKNLIDGLLHSQCKLQALSLSGHGLIQPDCEKMASAVESFIPELRELELSGNILWDLCPVLSVGLGSPKLEKLRLNRNSGIADICKELVTAFKSNSCCLRELELSYASLKDSEIEILSTGLKTNCTLEVLNLSHNKLTEKGCETLASALSSESSRLTELNLSANDLQDSGVMALCTALINPCCLKTLKLSFCKVTKDGCAALDLALRSEQCSLRELNLSFNHLTDQGVELLTEIQRDSRYSLEELNVDQNEEFWFDLKLLRQYACDLTLDPNTAGVNAILTEENKKGTYVHEKQPYPDHPDRFDCCQVLCEEGLTGRHYWEVECLLADVGVAYKSIKRVDDCSSEICLGKNEKSWCWFQDGSFHHNNSCLKLLDCSTKWSTIGVYLDWPAGILSFFEVFPDKMTHLYTVCTKFTEPLHPGFNFHDGSIYLCKVE